MNSKWADERVMKSVTQFIEKDLKLIVNQDKSKVGSPTRLKFLGCLIHRAKGACLALPKFIGLLQHENSASGNLCPLPLMRSQRIQIIEPPYTERYVRWCERSSS